MNIKIKSITLRNFKGLRDVSFDFDGRNATIIGDNGTGKTTIFDALTWVLFGKDSHNSTDIDIKTIDATGEPMHRAEHFVEVALDVDGSAQTLRRTYREIWSKPRGSSDLRFVGHESAFAVNGVEVGTKAAYDKIISEWINDNVFRMLTDPMYFNTRVDWKGRRAALLALVGDNIDRTAIQAQFADLLAEMNGEPLADFKARLATEKRKNKKELETFDPKIEAYQNTMLSPTRAKRAARIRGRKRDRSVPAANRRTRHADRRRIENRRGNAGRPRPKTEKGARHQKVVVRSYRRSTDRGPSV